MNRTDNVTTKKHTGKLLTLAIFGTLIMAALFSVALFADAENPGEGGEQARDHRPMNEGNRNLPSEADTDGDGVISEEERAAWRELKMAEREEQMNERFNELDADGDGSISREEWDAWHEQKKAEMEERKAERQAEMDADGDGEISEEERRAWFKGHKDEAKEKGRERMPHRPGPRKEPREPREPRERREPREPREPREQDEL